MATKALPCPTLLRQLLRYEPETGKLFWKERPPAYFVRPTAAPAWNERFAGKEAFTTRASGYCQGAVNHQNYYAHRVVWTLYHGVAPSGDLDHINGDRSDNRISNLRDVTRSINGRNVAMMSNNTSGVNGVCWEKNFRKWRVIICINGKRKHVGYFTNLEDAARARKDAELGKGFTARHGERRAP